jgi:hypothetical protein
MGGEKLIGDVCLDCKDKLTQEVEDSHNLWVEYARIENS